MRGIELAKAFYYEYGAEMIHEQFGEYEDRIAVGLAGHGSECFGYDDEISRDHDFETGFCLWINDEDDLEFGVELSRAYRHLPKDGIIQRSTLGERTVGVHRISDFYRRYTGSDGVPGSWQQWMSLPSYALAEACNGQVWRDDLGEFSDIREQLKYGMPEDVRKKKIAARAAVMAQAGQYNYSRCLKHGEEGAAMLSMAQFVDAAASMVFLLNRTHMPYYKWALRAMGELEKLSNLRDALEFLLTADNDDAGKKVKIDVIEDVCAAVVRELQAQGLTCGGWDYLEPHALDLMHHIENPEIRALHIMEG